MADAEGFKIPSLSEVLGGDDGTGGTQRITPEEAIEAVRVALAVTVLQDGPDAAVAQLLLEEEPAAIMVAWRKLQAEQGLAGDVWPPPVEVARAMIKEAAR